MTKLEALIKAAVEARVNILIVSNVNAMVDDRAEPVVIDPKIRAKFADMVDKALNNVIENWDKEDQ